MTCHSSRWRILSGAVMTRDESGAGPGASGGVRGGAEGGAGTPIGVRARDGKTGGRAWRTERGADAPDRGSKTGLTGAWPAATPVPR